MRTGRPACSPSPLASALAARRSAIATRSRSPRHVAQRPRLGYPSVLVLAPWRRGAAGQDRQHRARGPSEGWWRPGFLEAAEDVTMATAHRRPASTTDVSLERTFVK